ncbi:CASC3 family protein [Megaselia abdita]
MDVADTNSTITAEVVPTAPTPTAQPEEQPVAVEAIVQKSASVDLPQPKEAVQNESRSPDSTGGMDSVQSGEKSSAHHDSEYDTASELEDEVDNNYTADEGSEGSEEEDGSEEEEGTDISEEDDISDSEDRQLVEGQEPSDIRKKVDEDRSNPQYIPKKGTFYEHDDRTADEPIVEVPTTDDVIEISADSKNALSASQSKLAASKKWEKASAGDRWSHDRYDEGEQAPKSRSELVSSYGYDIRNEDGPPRARRRRRYARGPTKYERKWEDEDAYFKANNNNTSRRPPRAEDFPELGDRKSGRKIIRNKNNNFREEKENHAGIRTNPRNDRDRRDMPMRPDKDLSQPARDNDLNRRPKNSFKTGSSSNRQQPREFNSRSKPNYNENNRGPRKERDSFSKPLDSPNDRLKRRPEGNFSNQVGKNVMSQNQNVMNADQINQGMPRNFSNSLQRQSPQYPNDISQPSSSNLTARLQQLQNQQQQQQQQQQIRNEPSHVGSIQMHTLATQNQGIMPNSQLMDMQQQQTDPTRSKRYSSLRQRAQPEPQPSGNAQMAHHMPNPQLDTRNLQQLHEAQAQPQPYILQPEHANLIQLIQQENLQVQLQKMQLQQMQPQPTASSNKAKYAVPVQSQYQTPVVPQPPQSAYYATANISDYANSPAPTAQPYVNPQTFTQYTPTPGIQQPVAVAQPAAPNSNLPKVTAPPAQPPYVQAPTPTPQNPTATPPQPNVPYGNYPSYQNYNTVGGTTYFVAPPHQSTQRANVLPARRPTNPIPILPPTTDKNAVKKDDDGKSSSTIDTSENIDHILDNMFVQRAPYQPPSAIPPSNTQDEQSSQRVEDFNSGDRIDEQKKNLTNNSDESKPQIGSAESSNLQVNKSIENSTNSDSIPTPVTTSINTTTEEAA